MKIRLLTFSAVFASALLASGCSGDNSSFETPNTSSSPDNDSRIAQNNFTILFDPVNPSYYDPATNTYTEATSTVSVQIGDVKNRVITAPRTIEFRTEWGLIDPSCTTDDTGRCSVTWRSASPDNMPANLKNTIVAFSRTGQESFGDLNGDGIFDDGDLFNTPQYPDVEEPFINVDESYDDYGPTFTSGDIVIDTINGLDLTGANATHDVGDGLFNGPNCAHSTLCSTDRTVVAVWESASMLLNGGETFSIGGAINGLTGTLVLNLNGTDVTFTADTDYSFDIIAGLPYDITVTTQPAGQTCTVNNASATPTADVPDADVSCI